MFNFFCGKKKPKSQPSSPPPSDVKKSSTEDTPQLSPSLVNKEVVSVKAISQSENSQEYLLQGFEEFLLGHIETPITILLKLQIGNYIINPLRLGQYEIAATNFSQLFNAEKEIFDGVFKDYCSKEGNLTALMQLGSRF